VTGAWVEDSRKFQVRPVCESGGRATSSTREAGAARSRDGAQLVGRKRVFGFESESAAELFFEGDRGQTRLGVQVTSDAIRKRATAGRRRTIGSIR
jgi:hypothetical protein